MNDYNIALLLALVVSAIINVGLLWYNRQLVARLLFISENLNDLVALINAYKKHLSALYETEMYYGDETIKHLMSHTTSLREILQDYEDIADLTEPLEFEPNNEENEIEKNETDNQSEKDVLYAGTRRRDS